jgi:hypothetical protein
MVTLGSVAFMFAGTIGLLHTLTYTSKFIMRAGEERYFMTKENEIISIFPL